MKRETEIAFKSRPGTRWNASRIDLTGKRRKLIKFEQRPRSSSTGNSGDTTLKRNVPSNERLEGSTDERR